VILPIAAVFAVANWIAVWTGNKRLEYLAKPATMVALIAFAATLDADDLTRQRWFLLALVLSLAGDVFLMLPSRGGGPLTPTPSRGGGPLTPTPSQGGGPLTPTPSQGGGPLTPTPADRLFIAGLASFLLAHIAYIAGFGLDDVWPAVVVVGVMSLIVGTPVVRAVDRELLAPVVAYMVVITVMLAVAAGSGIAAAGVGAALFYASDGLIAYNRFVFAEPRRSVGVAIMVLYHAGQAGLVLSLVD
jgi:uncharacterized membrane protein YhhN